MGYLTYDQLGITVAVIAAALAFVVLVGNAVKTMSEWRQRATKPTDDALADHEQRISNLEECCKEVTGKLESDWKFQQASSEMSELMLLSIKQLLKHSIDGNDTEGLKNMEDEIDRYLIKHQKG